MRISFNGFTVDTDAINRVKNGMNNLNNGNYNNTNNKVQVKGNPVMFIIVGIIFLIGAVFAFNNISKEMEKQKLIEETYSKVIGEVQKVDERYDSLDEETEYYVTLVYVVEGTKYTYSFKSNSYVSRGDEYTMYYDPARPNISMLESETHTGNNMIILTLFLVFFGGVCFVAGIYGMIVKKKEKQAQVESVNINPSVMPSTGVNPNPSVMPNTGVVPNPSVLDQSQDNNQNNML